MFTGLIESTGTIRAVDARPEGGTRLTVCGPKTLVHRLQTGDSVSVSGVCLTALDIQKDGGLFSADLAHETVTRSSLAHLRSGSMVNLELPTPAGTPLGGHIVQGHVDGVGYIQSLQPADPHADPGLTDWWLRLSIPEDCACYVVGKGSIAVEGISLTVASIQATEVTIDIIPHTYKSTNLHTLAVGSMVNIEVDVLAKYAERLVSRNAREEKRFELTVGYLIANGY